MAGVPRPEAPVLLRRRQDLPRQLAARPDRRPAARSASTSTRTPRARSRACSRSTWTACSARRPGCGGNSPARSTTPTRSAPQHQAPPVAPFQEVTAELTEIADGVVAAGLELGGKPGRALNVAYENLGIALGEAYPTNGASRDRTMLDEILDGGPHTHGRHRLRALEAAALDHRCARRHGTWRLRRHHRQPAVPRRQEAHRRVGHQCPRLVRQCTWRAGKKGNADQVGYFFLRAMSLLNSAGKSGPHRDEHRRPGRHPRSRARPDGRRGFTITRAIQSRSWPVASANLEYAAVWGTRGAGR